MVSLEASITLYTYGTGKSLKTDLDPQNHSNLKLYKFKLYFR